MRYTQGSIHLSQSQDHALLKQVLRSEFVTQSQLYEFMRLRHQERSRRSFDWRLRRLVSHGLVGRVSVHSFQGERVYSIAPTGAAVLQGLGEYCLFAANRGESKSEQVNVLHALELNDIHLSLLRKEPSARWTYTTEIRSQNQLTSFGYSKEYDAVITVQLAGQTVQLALEYERTPKAKKFYEDIVDLLTREAQVGSLLYIMPNYDLLSYVSGIFAEAKLPVYFGLARDWHSQLLGMTVLDSSARSSVHLCDVLAGSVFTLRSEAFRG